MIKFLKRFKEKILIALACLFIGIGTLLNYTIETKAYTSDTFTHTLTIETYNNVSYYKVNPNFEYTRYNFLLINFTSSVSGNWTMDLNFYDSNYNRLSFDRINVYNVANGISFYYFIQDLSSYYCFNLSSVASNFTIVNLDYVNSNDLTTTYYAQTYIDNYNNLQSQYDTLLLDYQNYQNTHAYTNEQYNNLMSQNATLTQQVQALQSQYDTYVSLHSYTNTQYETLLNTFNNLQTMYNNLQRQYLDLQQEYNRLTIDLAPFRSAIWGNRQATLNGVTIDVSSSSNLNSVVWFRDSYLQIDQREFENFTPYIEGENVFQLVTTSDTIVTINNYTAIANFAHNLDYGFSIEFYLNDSLVNTTMFFHGSMTTDDGGTTNTYNYIAPITFNKMIIDIVGGPGPTSWSESSYFKGNPGTWQQGYDYAVEQLMPRINVLEDSLDEAISKQQIKYSEGYNEGFNARIIHNPYME